MKIQKERANAKINLYLDVLSKRDDGFHDIKTVMHSISLADEVTVIYKPSQTRSVKLSLKGNRFLPTDERNLAVKAATLYLETANINADIEIKLEKRIPIAAGLAGGSSDAAATLRAMNKIFGKLFADRVLFKMAASLGSDVPYCLYGKTALCEGRGEIITKLPDKLSLNVVVAIANERISTPQAYAGLDLEFSDFDGAKKTVDPSVYQNLMYAIEKGKLSSDVLFNVFERSVFQICPRANEIKNKMYALGAEAALMSGSGPSVFGIFENENQAEKACSALREDNIIAFFARSV